MTPTDALNVAATLDAWFDWELDTAFDVLLAERDKMQEAMSTINAERHARTKAENDRLRAALAANG